MIFGICLSVLRAGGVSALTSRFPATERPGRRCRRRLPTPRPLSPNLSSEDSNSISSTIISNKNMIYFFGGTD